MEKDFYQRVYEVVARIPKGKVTTYGAIARHLGTGGSARLVGWALNNTVSANAAEGRQVQRKKTGKNKAVNVNMTTSENRTTSEIPMETSKEPARIELLPCHRVVNRTGELTGKIWFGGDLMEQLLRSEGVTFDDRGRVNLGRHYWEP
ncbi:MAG: MGMT family protein [Balneolales bacterium]